MRHEKDSTHPDAFENGGRRPWAGEAAASRSSVYNQQKNMDLSLKLQGTEFFQSTQRAGSGFSFTIFKKEHSLPASWL